MAAILAPPEPIDSFVGREHELQDVANLVRSPSTRLVTITGVGGVGKTRLALRVANAVAQDFSEGVYFVDLSLLADFRIVALAIADAIGVSTLESGSVEAIVREHLQDREALLVLDNFEHLPQAARFIANLLLNCPSLEILVTSREPLLLSGEHVYKLEPLDVPPMVGLNHCDKLASYPAVALFIQRARAVNHQFILTKDNAGVVAEISRRLDGLPLAIELAAARVRHMNEDDLLRGLATMLSLLVDGPRDRPERQRTLRATISWTYELLSNPERDALVRLSAFIGGFSDEAAQAICSQSGLYPDDESTPTVKAMGHMSSAEINHMLYSLVDHGLVKAERSPSGNPRYVMLETIRQFGREELLRRGELDTTNWELARYYAGLAERTQPLISGQDPAPWLDMLDLEWSNLRFILGWLISQDGRGSYTAMRICTAIWEFWKLRGRVREGKALLEQAHRASGDAMTSVGARAMIVLGHLEVEDLSKSKAYYEQGLGVYRQLGDELGEIRALGNLGMVCVHMGDTSSGKRYLLECATRFQQIGDISGVALAHYHLGCLEAVLGNSTSAKRYLDRARELWQQLKDITGVGYVALEFGRLYARQGHTRSAMDLLLWSRQLFHRTGASDAEGIVLCQLGRVQLESGSLDDAVESLHSAIESFSTARAHHGYLASSLEDMARIASRRHLFDVAVRIWASTEKWRMTFGHTLVGPEREIRDRELGAARAQVGSRRYHELWIIGEQLPLDEAVRLALEEPHIIPRTGAVRSDATDGQYERLSAQQLRVLCLITRQGLTNQQISETLNIKVRTVTTHIDRIFAKLRVENRTAAAAVASRLGLCEG